MQITVTSQNVDTHKKKIERDGLKGITYFIQMANSVRVTASQDHQAIVQGVLGKPDSDNHHQLSSYWTGYYGFYCFKSESCMNNA